MDFHENFAVAEAPDLGATACNTEMRTDGIGKSQAGVACEDLDGVHWLRGFLLEMLEVPDRLK
ncbi:MAG TPA: hypothetical protein VGK20_15035 [Candidatus Binatia bacterium]